MENLGNGWGTFLKFKVRTETRAFDRVEAALAESGIAERHVGRDGERKVLLARPDRGTAFARAMNCLTRVCAASIPFPSGSKHTTWQDGVDAVGNSVMRTGDRNPCYSLKIEAVRRAATDTAVAYRINISDRTKAAGNMAHVLTAVYEAGVLNVYAGSQADMAAEFGSDLEILVREEYARFCNNYDDTDVRGVIDAELTRLRALQVLGKTTNFVARDAEGQANTECAERLVGFIKACGHDSELLGIDGSERSRDALLSELTASIMDEFESFEETLRAKLDKPTGERKRGDKQRERMHGNAVKDIEGIMALADYHCAVLGATVGAVAERKAELLKLASDFLTRDFGMSQKEKALAAAKAAVVAAPVAIPAAPAAAADPFAAIAE